MASSTPISPRCSRMSRMIRQARQMASVASIIRCAGVASKPCSRISCSLYMPQPSTNSGASTSRRLRVGRSSAAESCRWWPGYASWMLVLEIDAQLCSRIAPGSPSTDGVTM